MQPVVVLDLREHDTGRLLANVRWSSCANDIVGELFQHLDDTRFLGLRFDAGRLGHAAFDAFVRLLCQIDR